MKKYITLVLVLYSLSLTAQFQFYNTFTDTTYLQFQTIHNHNNQFYIVTGLHIAHNPYNIESSIIKFDTTGKILRKIYYSAPQDFYPNYSVNTNFLWKDSAFYHFYRGVDSIYHLMAFNYNLDTLWTEKIVLTDTNLFLDRKVCEIINLANDEILLLFPAYKKMPNWKIHNYTIYTKIKDYGNHRTIQHFKKYIPLTAYNHTGHTVVTSDSSLIRYSNSYLRKYNLNGILIDSLYLPLRTNHDIYNIKYYGDNKYICTGMANSDVGDPFEYKINMAMIDYAKWKLIWIKTYPIEQSVLEATPILINVISDSNIVFTSNLEYGRNSTNYNSKYSGFHLILNNLGDSINFFRVLDDSKNHYTISDINFIDGTTALGVGSVFDNPLDTRYSTTAVIYKRNFKIPLPPKEQIDNKEFSWSLYPNPSFEEFQLEISKNFVGTIADIEIFNYDGKQIAHYPSFVLKNLNMFKVNQMSSGIYFFVITIGANKYTKRLTVI